MKGRFCMSKLGKDSKWIAIMMASFMLLSVFVPGFDTWAAGGWSHDSGGWYYMVGDDYYAGQWANIDGSWYYFDSSGYMEYSCYRDGCWLGENGAWAQDYSGGQWKTNGEDWWFEDNSWYHADQWLKINGEYYYFNSSGYMESNCYRDGCWLGENGAWDPDYYGGEWKTDGERWWYEDNGWFPTNIGLWINGDYYWFDADGYWDGEETNRRKSEDQKPEEPKPEEKKPEEQKKDNPEPEKPEDPKPENPDPEKPEDPKDEEKKEQKIELSGNPDEVIKTDINSYYESKRFFLYIEKGCEIRGDIAVKLEGIMDELEEMYSLSYNKRFFDGDSDWRDFYFGGSFYGINEDCDKINVLIMDYKDDGRVEWATNNLVLLFDEDFDPQDTYIDVTYHEFTHLLRLNQSQHMGDIFEEGIAVNSQYRLAQKHNLPVWSIFVYTRDEGLLNPFDESVILNDAEQAFRDIEAGERDENQKEYQYGIRFVTFLLEEYGNDVIKDISDAAYNSNLEYGDTDKVISIIKQETSDDVFEKFSAWLPEGWDKFCTEYNNYMSQFEETY